MENSKKLKIALVDDELALINGRLSKFTCQMNMFGSRLEEYFGASNIHFYTKGADLLEVVRKNHFTYDLILIDYELKYDEQLYEFGHLLGNAIQMEVPHVALVMLSNYNKFPNCREAMQAGFVDFLPKIELVEDKEKFISQIEQVLKLASFKSKQAARQLSLNNTWDSYIQALNQKAREDPSWYAHTLIRWLFVGKLLRKPAAKFSSQQEPYVYSLSNINWLLPAIEALCETKCPDLKLSQMAGKPSFKRKRTTEAWLKKIVESFAFIELNDKDRSFLDEDEKKHKGKNIWGRYLTTLKSDKKIIEVAVWLLSAQYDSKLHDSAQRALKDRIPSPLNFELMINCFKLLAEQVPNIKQIAELVEKQIIPEPIS